MPWSTRSTRLVVVALLLIALLLPGASLLAQRASAEPAPEQRSSARAGGVVVGEKVAINGRVPQKVRRPVVLQKRVAKTWRRIDRSQTDRKGRFHFKLRARAGQLRVLAPSVRVGRERLPAWTSSRRVVRVQHQRGALSVAAPGVPGGTLDGAPLDDGEGGGAAPAVLNCSTCARVS